eukprot:510855_1
MNGVMRMRMQRRRIDAVWQCTKCENVRVHDKLSFKSHQICEKCGSMTTPKLRCRLQCHIILPFDITTCPKCNFELKHYHSIEQLFEDDNNIQKNTFLKVCNNFKSDAENALLFCLGFIHQIVEKNVYKTFPIDIAQLCIRLAYDLKNDPITFNNKNYSWNEQLAYDLKNDSITLNSDKTEMIFNKNDKDGVIFGYGLNMNWLIETDRKIWKIKVNKVNAQEFSFSIGIEFEESGKENQTFEIMIKNGVLQPVNENKPNKHNLMQQFSNFFASFKSDNDIYLMDNDIISILTLRLDEKKHERKPWLTTHNLIRFAVNDTICPIEFNDILVDKRMSWNEQKLRITMYNSVKMTIV